MIQSEFYTNHSQPKAEILHPVIQGVAHRLRLHTQKTQKRGEKVALLKENENRRTQNHKYTLFEELN